VTSGPAGAGNFRPIGGVVRNSYRLGASSLVNTSTTNWLSVVVPSYTAMTQPWAAIKRGIE